jgi:hypothetical protein
LATNLFTVAGRPSIRLVAAIVTTSVAQAIAVVLGSYIDGTWYLSGTGKGLFQHYAAWALLCTDPLLVLATGFAYYRFKLTLTRLPVRPERRKEYQRFVAPFLQYVSGQGNAAFVYALCVVIGVLSWLNNIRQTIDAVPFYHHEVFDSLSHPFGFVGFKACLFLSWVVVYPIVGFLLLSMSVSIYLILERGSSRDILWPHVTHPDNCYGLRDVGSLNIALLSPYLLTYSVMFAVLVTLGYYGSILIPLVALTIIFIAVSYIVLMPAHTLLKAAKEKTFTALARRSSAGTPRDTSGISEFAVERLCFATATASPYSEKAKLVLAIMRAIPIITVAIKFLERFHVLA